MCKSSNSSQRDIINPTMSIQKRLSTNGKTRWIARYRDPAGKEHSKTFNTQRQAKTWLADTQAHIARGQWVDPNDGRITFGQLFTEWVESASRQGTKTTRQFTENNLGTLADMPVQKIRRSHIQTWVNSLADGTGSTSGKALSPITVRSCLKHVSTVFSQAVFDRIITTSPVQRIHTEPVSNAVDKDKIPTTAQVSQMVTAAGRLHRPHADVLVMLLAATGLRASEACGLERGDIDFLRKRISVRRQRATDGATAPLKTLSARREVHIPEPVLLRLAPLCGGESHLPVFTSKQGAPWTRIDVASIFASIKRSTKLPFTAHSLRHFYASGLIAQGVDVRSVQAALGHASATVTLSTYAHLWETSEDRVARAGDGLVPDFCGMGDKSDDARSSR